MANSNASNLDDNKTQKVTDAKVITKEDKKENSEMRQTFFLLKKNTEAIIEQIKKKNKRLKLQDDQIRSTCQRVKSILDQDVENSLLEDFEESGGSLEDASQSDYTNLKNLTKTPEEEGTQVDREEETVESQSQEEATQLKEYQDENYDDYDEEEEIQKRQEEEQEAYLEQKRQEQYEKEAEYEDDQETEEDELEDEINRSDEDLSTSAKNREEDKSSSGLWKKFRKIIGNE
jgi:hypothetical protein